MDDIQKFLDAARLMGDMESRVVAQTDEGDYAVSTVLRPEVFSPSDGIQREAAKCPYESALLHGGEYVRFWRWANLEEAQEGHVSLVRTLQAGPPYDWT